MLAYWYTAGTSTRTSTTAERESISTLATIACVVAAQQQQLRHGQSKFGDEKNDETMK